LCLRRTTRTNCDRERITCADCYSSYLCATSTTTSTRTIGTAIHTATATTAGDNQHLDHVLSHLFDAIQTRGGDRIAIYPSVIRRHFAPYVAEKLIVQVNVAVTLAVLTIGDASSARAIMVPPVEAVNKPISRSVFPFALPAAR
jgi:hypothetical protein